MDQNHQLLLEQLFTRYTSEKPIQIQALPPSGSYRLYYRITGMHQSLIGVYNEDAKENRAFCTFTRHFQSLGLPVPALLAEDLDNNIYLLDDLGDTMLLNILQEQGDFTPIVREAYQKTLSELPRFQVEGAKGFDYSVCYPRQAFDRQSMMWDLNYFKYYFLKLARVPFDEQELENDYVRFCDFLLSADCSYFLYRDFQSRNVMFKDNQPYFIDYQGGRQGALHYDIASILFEAKTALSPELRMELLDHYLTELSKYIPVDRTRFLDHFYGYALIRTLQAMGAYGFRGLYEKKELFLQSIPPAINNIAWLIENRQLPVQLPELMNVLRYICQSDDVKSIADKYNKLTVSINSFSYKRGIPVDESPNGGGFVFDCRAIHNPGRYDQYKTFTGKDEPVKAFFAKEPEMHQFLEDVFRLVDTSVEKYQQRGFKHLMVNFGCTGGQHRSVFAAEKLTEHLKQKYDINVFVRHREQELNRGV